MRGLLIFKYLVLVTISLTLGQVASAQEHNHATTLSPEQEKLLFLGVKDGRKSRDLTTWNECRGDVEAYFLGSKCSKERVISPTLKKYINSDFLSCVNEALLFSGRDNTSEIEISHKGIMADVRHSPLSLHSFGRAIDIHSIKVRYSIFRRESFNFEADGDASFFSTLRLCWGRVILEKNQCPLFENKFELTGTIGKEDEDHQKHLHLSVPFCQSGNYSEDYFIR